MNLVFEFGQFIFDFFFLVFTTESFAIVFCHFQFNDSLANILHDKLEEKKDFGIDKGIVTLL